MINGFVLKSDDEDDIPTLTIERVSDEGVAITVDNGKENGRTLIICELADVMTGLALLYPELNIQTKRANNA